MWRNTFCSNIIVALLRDYAAQKRSKLNLAEEISSNLVYDTSEKLQTIGSRIDNLAISPIESLIEDTVRETKVNENVH